MTTFFKKSEKKTILGPFWALFAKIWAKMNFLGKKRALPVFRYSNYLPQCQPNEPFLRVNTELTDRLADRQTDRQTTVIL